MCGGHQAAPGACEDGVGGGCVEVTRRPRGLKLTEGGGVGGRLVRGSAPLWA